ncbi:hypothetical protein TRFO_05347 [Tritrichomonas foetus]|uniref:Thioredoxin domain-containing protein n=1 Tax=Tritrichomonas foetus TaxID=1144522 RepID=A0A1J4K819_9EUKA|nr:hypothetical protein TRFO_05347 [Tritrichomonas foetus]|eukprot:OHT07114.1 hypothetical protein TRFO_05347 [Tritrichomonas foetus]
MMTGTPVLPRLDRARFSAFKTNQRPLLVLVIGDYASPLCDSAISKMASMSLEFSSQALIAVITESQATEIFAEVKLETPFLAYYIHGKLFYSAEYNDDELALAFTIRNWIHGPRFANNYLDLYKMLGDTPLSIVTTEDSINEAFQLHPQIAQLYGSVELIITVKSVFTRLNISERFAVYNQLDQNLNGFDNLSDFAKAQEPHYKILSSKGGDGLVAAVFDYDLTKEYRDMLYSLKEKFSDFTFGLANEKLFEKYFDFTHKKLEDFPQYLIFDLDDGFYYPMPENETFENYIQIVSENKIEKVFMSEPESNEIDDEVMKLVGSTYKGFVEDRHYDAVVLYDTPENSPYIYELFRSTAEKVTELVENINFAFIDPTKNASPHKLPTIYTTPHIELFRKDGTSIPMLNIVSQEGLLRFLHHFSTFGAKIPTSEMSKEQAKIEKSRIERIYPISYANYIEMYNKMFASIYSSEI